MNTLPAVANGESLTIVSNVGTVTELTAVPDIAAVNLHNGVSLVIVGSNNAVLDGGHTVRGLFAYAGRLRRRPTIIASIVGGKLLRHPPLSAPRWPRRIEKR